MSPLGSLILITTLSTAQSDEKDLVRMPKLTGHRVAIASQMARISDLKPVTGVFYIAPESWRNDIHLGTAYMQTPQPETKIPKGATVAIWTFRKASSKQKIVKMPLLKAKNLKEVKKRLSALGLKVMNESGFNRVEDSTTKVIDHYPTPGQQVFVGTGVYLRFSTAKGR